MPYGLSGSAMVCSPNGDGVIVIGGWNSEIGKDSVEVLELKTDSNEWQMLETKLQFGRRFHVALPISTEIWQKFQQKSRENALRVLDNDPMFNPRRHGVPNYPIWGPRGHGNGPRDGSRGPDLYVKYSRKF